MYSATDKINSAPQLTNRQFRLFLLLVLTATYFSIGNIEFAYFNSDDFIHVAYAKNNGLAPSSFLKPINEHFSPLFRMIMALEYQFFQTDATGYYRVNVLLHMMNVLLCVLLFSKLLGDRSIGLLAGLVFGITASHWRVAIWITTQGQLLATFFFLLATLCFVLYLKHQQMRYWLLSIVCHLAMLASFTAGLEIPLGFFLLFLAYRHYHPLEASFKKKLITAIKIIWPFALNVIVYLLIRNYFISAEQGLVEKLGGLEGLWQEFPTTLLYVTGGFYRRFMRSFTGSYQLQLPQLPEYIYVISVLILVLLLTDWSKKGIRRHHVYLFCFIGWVLLISYPPTYPRLSYGYQWFVSRSRYWYLPGTLVAGIVAIFIKSLIFFTQQNKSYSRILKYFFIAFFVFVSLSNITYLQERILKVVASSQSYRRSISIFLLDMRSLLTEEKSPRIRFVNHLISSQDAHTSWNVTTKILADIYLSEPERKRLTFLDPKNQNLWDKEEPIYYADPHSRIHRYSEN